VKKATWSVLSQQASSHIRSRVHSRFMLEESGECVPGVFDWFEGLLGLSGWCEGKCHGIGCKKLNGVA